ncbi:hypothetical protein GCM10008090_23980 [Arenicella chitinivorans]|uniref:Uncharacterized protein n=1 Tax=Arenicella chitinivorans TaxID=1329800 RepID=A0A918RUR4_9GAMM|nr:hypothetical protein [Arenicella chitinivorans]GHA13449.1 hypothetical protein GCM10008090_23980 [Arenicella chitinivorans]
MAISTQLMAGDATAKIATKAVGKPRGSMFNDKVKACFCAETTANGDALWRT